MIRYFFLADFDAPEDGPRFEVVSPFDKCEVVQGDTPYPPAPESQVIVSIECQAHTKLCVARDGDAAADPPVLPVKHLDDDITLLELQMGDAALLLADSYEYLGVEEY